MAGAIKLDFTRVAGAGTSSCSYDDFLGLQRALIDTQMGLHAYAEKLSSGEKEDCFEYIVFTCYAAEEVLENMYKMGKSVQEMRTYVLDIDRQLTEHVHALCPVNRETTATDYSKIADMIAKSTLPECTMRSYKKDPEPKQADAERPTCFGQRFRCSDFSQRQRDTGAGGTPAAETAAGSIFRRFAEKAANRVVGAEMEHARGTSAQTSLISRNGIIENPTNKGVQATEDAANGLKKVIGRAGKDVSLKQSIRGAFETAGSIASRIPLRAVGKGGVLGLAATAVYLNQSDPDAGKRARFGQPLSRSDFLHDPREPRIPTRAPAAPAGEPRPAPNPIARQETERWLLNSPLSH